LIACALTASRNVKESKCYIFVMNILSPPQLCMSLKRDVFYIYMYISFLYMLARLLFYKKQTEIGMRHPFSIYAKLEIEKHGECFLTPKRVELLRKIKTSGSILAASKEMKMSYQQAWSFVKQMNELSPLPLVTRQRGGSHGGVHVSLWRYVTTMSKPKCSMPASIFKRPTHPCSTGAKACK